MKTNPLFEGFGCLFGSALFGSVIARWFANFKALDDVWDWNGMVAGWMALVTTVIPGLGGYVGYVGAAEGWGWKGWMLAIPWLPEIELGIMIVGSALAAAFSKEK